MNKDDDLNSKKWLKMLLLRRVGVTLGYQKKMGKGYSNSFVSTSHLFGARMVYDFSESGTRMEQLFGGPNRGPNRTTFRGPGLLAVDVSPGTLWMPLFQFAHMCPPPIFSEPEWYTTFRGPNPGPESNDFSARGSWLWIMFFQGLFGGHRFNLHICVHQPSFRGSNGIRLFGARIRNPNGTAFRGPNRGPNRTTFRGPGLLAVDVPPGALWRPPFQSALPWVHGTGVTVSARLSRNSVKQLKRTRGLKRPCVI